MREIIDYKISNMDNTLQAKADLSQFLLSDAWPTEWLGDDPGTPRKMNFNELMEQTGEDEWHSIQPSPSTEALVDALDFLQMIGVSE